MRIIVDELPKHPAECPFAYIDVLKGPLCQLNLYGACTVRGKYGCTYFKAEKSTDACPATNPTQKPTRADQIRAMSDEELAKWINHHPICPYDREDLDDHVCKLNCKQCWLDWLRQEADG